MPDNKTITKRATKQKGAISAALKKAGRPLSAVEICDSAKKDVPSVNLATVYRQLKSMLEDRELVAVELPGMPPRFELPDLGHHHHFFCNICDRVFDVDGCSVKFCSSDIQKLVPKGFKLHDHAILLYGACKECR